MFRAHTALALVLASTVVAGLSPGGAVASGRITYDRTDHASGGPTNPNW